MALRLSSTPEVRPVAPVASFAERLSARADARLTAHDLHGWAAVLDEADACADRDDRYEARRTLAERALAHDGGTPAQIAERLAVAAARLVRMLEEEPREPMLLNLAGVAFYELGSLSAAHALFEAAGRLDPALPHLQRNLAEVRRRRQAGVRAITGLPRDVAQGLKALAPRARRAADRARPAEGLTLALCMIVKDEEAMLGQCLASVKDAVDEMIVVDTGSTDRTVEIAREHGARVVHHEWQDDFAAARNVSFDAATTDWILYLDADEVVVEGDAQRLRELTGRTWREAFLFVERNHLGAMEDGLATTHNAMRMFRNRPERRFVGRLHEQIQGIPDALPERQELSTVRIDHFGYLGEVRVAKGKEQRNLQLLEQQIADGDDSPFLHFNLGMEHVAAGDPTAAARVLGRAWELLPAHARGVTAFGPVLSFHLVQSLRQTDRPAEAERVAAEALEAFPGFTDVVLEQGHLAVVAGDPAAAERLYRQCLEMGDAPSAYAATVGAGTYLAARALADLLVAQDRLEDAAAVLERSLVAHPGHARTARELADVLLRRGVPGEGVVARIEELVPDPSPELRQAVASALGRRGVVDLAEPELRAVIAARPQADQARMALVETLQLQGRFADAAEQALAVRPGSPEEPAALRHAAFCLLAEGLDATPALVRTATVLAGAEHELFTAWAGAGGAPGPAVADQALTMLSALARFERFEAFEGLVRVFEALAIPWRQRREALAQLYLRRGFLQSAAEEWMAVVERDGPDVEALRGLAAVAAASGLDDDAAVFAADADALAAV